MSRPVAALVGALLLGALGFVGGFFGPLLLTPEANQGPLLGIFITGPIGVFVGLLLGWAIGPSLRRASRP